MDRLISYFIALAVAAGAMFAWDRHGPLGWHHRVLFWEVGFDLPDSLLVQRDKAVLASAQNGRLLAACQVNESRLQAAVDAQNGAIAELQTQANDWQAKGQQALAAQKRVSAALDRQAAEILAAKRTSADACADARALVLKEIGQ